MARKRLRDTALGRTQFRLPRVSMRLLVPNLVTLLALCAGLTAIRFAIEGRQEPALIAIVVAGLLDGMDGRLARFLKGTSRFGAELDSLADFVNFGVAPALILYITFLHDFGSLGWIVALIFAIAMALRLARFNTQLDVEDKPRWQGLFFTGIPAPAGALCALLPLYLVNSGLSLQSIPAFIVLAYTLLIALLAVSRWPAYSGKNLQVEVSREHVALLIVAITAVISLLVAYTFPMLAILTIAYLASLPFSYRSYQRHARLQKNQDVYDTD